MAAPEDGFLQAEVAAPEDGYLRGKMATPEGGGGGIRRRSQLDLEQAAVDQVRVVQGAVGVRLPVQADGADVAAVVRRVAIARPPRSSRRGSRRSRKPISCTSLPSSPSRSRTSRSPSRSRTSRSPSSSPVSRHTPYDQITLIKMQNDFPQEGPLWR